MTRSILTVIAVGLAVGIVAATGCSQTGVGDPCTPEQEFNTQFNGFSDQEVNVESKSFQCQTRLCLVNHFQGRVSCPYGQDVNGNPPAEADMSVVAKAGCAIPGGVWQTPGPNATDDIVGDPNDPKTKATVAPQCAARQAINAVYCSCRCANLNNQTNDGANYCTCPDGFACTQLVTSIGAGDTGLTGAYCIKNGTQFSNGGCNGLCDPALKNCGTQQL
jgi:hypothetical protein